MWTLVLFARKYGGDYAALFAAALLVGPGLAQPIPSAFCGENSQIRASRIQKRDGIAGASLHASSRNPCHSADQVLRCERLLQVIVEACRKR